MDIRTLTNDISVAPQIAVDEVAAAAKAGFKTIICNRPDQEELGQPNWDAMAAAAETAGMKAHYLPVISGQMTQEQVDAFGAIFEQAEKPVLAYCRSGTRSTFLWALSRDGNPGKSDIMSAAAQAGYDLSPLAEHLKD